MGDSKIGFDDVTFSNASQYLAVSVGPAVSVSVTSSAATPPKQYLSTQIRLEAGVPLFEFAIFRIPRTIFRIRRTITRMSGAVAAQPQQILPTRSTNRMLAVTVVGRTDSNLSEPLKGTPARCRSDV